MTNGAISETPITSIQLQVAANSMKNISIAIIMAPAIIKPSQIDGDEGEQQEDSLAPTMNSQFLNGQRHGLGIRWVGQVPQSGVTTSTAAHDDDQPKDKETEKSRIKPVVLAAELICSGTMTENRQEAGQQT